ncbi:hypothetical protein [Afifella sp. IM 167]|uniref:hypothetical protein n=1 Tax=Afifella sp. IM 167 TaxID=2033586 RepID=UPI001CCA5A15|nr:hypothetical protein [Afifella sp. IM 167]MBZ8133309.1 hypothetical protein [Afifella sp. IM 167]
MSNLSFFLALGLAAATGGSVVAVLYRPLLKITTDLCEAEYRGRFWTAYACVMLVIAPVLALSFATAFGHVDWNEPLFLQRLVFAALLGLTIAMAIFGYGVWEPTRRIMEERRAEAARESRQVPPELPAS